MQDASWLHLNYAGLYKTISSIVVDMHEYYEQSANQISLLGLACSLLPQVIVLFFIAV